MVNFIIEILGFKLCKIDLSFWESYVELIWNIIFFLVFFGGEEEGEIIRYYFLEGVFICFKVGEKF